MRPGAPKLEGWANRPFSAHVRTPVVPPSTSGSGISHTPYGYLFSVCPVGALIAFRCEAGLVARTTSVLCAFSATLKSETHRLMVSLVSASEPVATQRAGPARWGRTKMERLAAMTNSCENFGLLRAHASVPASAASLRPPRRWSLSAWQDVHGFGILYFVRHRGSDDETCARSRRPGNCDPRSLACGHAMHSLPLWSPLCVVRVAASVCRARPVSYREPGPWPIEAYYGSRAFGLRVVLRGRAHRGIKQQVTPRTILHLHECRFPCLRFLCSFARENA